MGMQVENLNEDNMSELEEKLKLIERKCPEVTHKTFPMDDLDLAKQIKELKVKVGSLSDMITVHTLLFKKVFGNYILIHGKWVDPNIADV